MKYIPTSFCFALKFRENQIIVMIIRKCIFRILVIMSKLTTYSSN